MKKIFLLLVCFLPMLMQAQIPGNISGPVTQSALPSLINEVKGVEEKIKSIAADIGNLVSQVRELSRERALFEKELQNKQKEIKSLRERENRTKEENARLDQLNSEVAVLNSKIEQINRNIENKQKQIDQLNAEVDALEDKIDKLEQKMAAAANKERAESKGSQKTDSVITVSKITFYSKAAKLLQSDPSIRAGLTAAELKTLGDFENKYKKDNAFKLDVDKSLQERSAGDSKEYSGAAKDLKKAQLDALKKYLALLATLNPQI